MNKLTDQQLLRDYAERRSEPAFTELVRRHIDVVHSAAFRLTGEAFSAQDVTQGVFLALAQNAARLARHPVLSGWLHTTARNLAAKNVRTAVRREQHELKAAVMNELLSGTSDASWEQIAAHLDAALGELSEPDRDAVMLRYFEKKSAPEMAQILGVSDEAAQKRTSRAVEKLREFFAKRKITIATGVLVALISGNAVQSAPLGLANSISAAALASASVSASAIIAATKIIAMTTLQKTLITAAVVVLAGVGIYEARQAAELRDRVHTLQQTQPALADRIQKLQAGLTDATNRLTDLLAENSRLKSHTEHSELLKLRAEMTRLREGDESRYQGKTLAEWLEASKDLNSVNPSDTPADRQGKDAAREALYDAARYFGPKGVPTLLQWVENTTNSGGNFMAAMCIQKLGPDAKAATPGLVALLNSDDQMTRYSAFNVLQRIGPAASDALPAILDHIQNDPADSMRSFAVTTLANSGIGNTDPDKVVPILIDSLKPANAVINRPDTLRALAGLGPKAKAAVPAILPFLGDSNQDVRAAAANALSQIDPSALSQSQ